MRSSSVRLLLFVAAATAVVVAFLSSDVSTSPRAALASHTGGADSFLIDMDPTGNSATSVGVVQDCARINKNGVQDADEDAIDTVVADVVARNIPVVHPIVAFEARIQHGTNVYLENADFSQMLLANPGSALTFADVYRPTLNDTILRAHDAEAPYSVTAESGSGVLVRTVWHATNVGPSIEPLTLRASGHIDPANQVFAPDNALDADPSGGYDNWILPGSRIAIDQPCPPSLGPTDIEVTSLQIAVPSKIYAGQPFAFQAITTLTNLGSVTISQDLVKTPMTLFSGCSYEREPLTFGPPVPAGDSVSVISTWTTTCNSIGTSIVYGYAAAIILDAIDTDPGNNVLILPPTNITVWSNDPDGDGVGGSDDLCPDTPPGAVVDARGCSLAQVDSDGDGVCNPDAPSNGPSPGCVRSVAVGGMVGLIAESEETATAGPGNAGSSSSPTLATIAAVAASIGALGAAGVYLRRRGV